MPFDLRLLLAVAAALLMIQGLHRLTRRYPDLPPGELFPLWLALGLGSGLAPKAPGTFGSVVGLAWLGLLLWPGSWLVLGLGLGLSIPVSVYLCGRAETLLGRADPGEVVLDEIIAIPLSFVAFLALHHYQTGALPGVESLLTGDQWTFTLALFAGFRFFDIVKPWPVRASQRLPGGWGVTVDDLLAALYVNLATVVGYFGYVAWSQRT